MADENMIREGIKLAYESRDKMRKLPSFKRKEILLKIAEMLKKREVSKLNP